MQNNIASGQADPPAGLEEVMQVYWERIYTVVFRIVGDRYEAEDLALETFWQLHRNPPHNRANLAGWLYRVATNLGLNALRSRQRRAARETQVSAESRRTAENPAEEVERRLERARVRHVLSQMESRDAHLLILRHSGLSYAEVAEALELNPASVGKLLSRASADFEQRYRQLEKGA
jgi:RNA polymerase sigma-70 factor (ECF subfamily)